MGTSKCKKSASAAVTSSLIASAKNSTLTGTTKFFPRPLANSIPERFELVPWEAVRVVAETLTKGLADHDEGGWRKLPRREHVGRALRHLAMYLISGSEEDLTHAATRCLMSLEVLDDDRGTKGEMGGGEKAMGGS
jgi:hypothetical protein